MAQLVFASRTEAVADFERRVRSLAGTLLCGRMRALDLSLQIPRLLLEGVPKGGHLCSVCHVPAFGPGPSKLMFWTCKHVIHVECAGPASKKGKWAGCPLCAPQRLQLQAGGAAPPARVRPALSFAAALARATPARAQLPACGACFEPCQLQDADSAPLRLEPCGHAMHGACARAMAASYAAQVRGLLDRGHLS